MVRVCIVPWITNFSFFVINMSTTTNYSAARSQAWVCGRSLAGVTGSNPEGSIDVCLLWVLCVLSGIGLCVEPITGPGESYRVWCVCVISGPRKGGGCRAMKKKKKQQIKVACNFISWFMWLEICTSYEGGKTITDWGCLEEYFDQRGRGASEREGFLARWCTLPYRQWPDCWMTNRTVAENITGFILSEQLHK